MSASNQRMSRRWGHQLFDAVAAAWRYLASQSNGLIHTSRANTFRIVSFFVLLLGMLTTSWWLGTQVEQRVMQHAISLSTLYIDSFVAPMLQDFDGTSEFTPEEIAELDRVLTDTSLGREIVALVVWGKEGQVLYSSNHAQIGQFYPIDQTLIDTFAGQVVSEVNKANEVEHIPPQVRSEILLAMYNPVRHRGTREILVAAEFYQAADPLLHDIYTSQLQSWLVIGAITIVMYLLLVGFVQSASDTIDQQQAKLSAQVVRLTDLLEQNTELHDRMRQASHRAATLNERVLRQISAELHDGPAQYLGLALLHLDRVAEFHEQQPDTKVAEHVTIVESSLSEAMREVRTISAGLGLPQLGELTPQDVIDLVVRTHERHTNSSVAICVQDAPEQISIALKSTLYRVVQESLTNAYRHGQGRGQRVQISSDSNSLFVEVADEGPGFEIEAISDAHEHLGLVGMRDRVESLGGHFRVESTIGKGTTVKIELPLHEVRSVNG